MAKSRGAGSPPKGPRKSAIAEESNSSRNKSAASEVAEKPAAEKPQKKQGTLHHFPSKRSEQAETPARRRSDAKPTQRHEPKPPFPKQKQSRPGLEAEIEPRPRYGAPNYRGADKLKGKVALITGGDSGIGRAVAVLYAREGADVAIVYLPEEQVDAEETAEAVQGEGRRAILIPGDLTDAEFCREAVEETVEEFGKLDILVNNAAYQEHQERPEDITDEQWDRTFQTNIYGYFRMAKAALEHMKPGSTIVNTGSITGLEGNKQLLDYASTKGAIHAFTKSLAQNLVERKIRVNCVSPGPVWTPLNVADKEPTDVSKHGDDVPVSRPAQPEEVAPAYVFFASDVDSSYITGEILTLLR